MLISSEISKALDPVKMAQAAGIVPDDWQAKVLRSTSQRILLNCSRQSGKSTVTGLLAMHTAIYEPGSLILLLSPSQRQSGELFRSCLNVYRSLDRPVPPSAESALKLELENGSRIISLPGKESTIRGLAGVRLLCVDESSRVEDGLYFAIRPMLAVSHGRLIALSTPFGSRGWWYEAWRSSEQWDRFKIPATDCPRISAEFLAEEERTLGEWWYRQEYCCEFLDAQTSAFRSQDLERIVRPELSEWIF